MASNEKLCPKCGMKSNVEKKFCQKCGYRFSPASPFDDEFASLYVSPEPDPVPEPAPVPEPVFVPEPVPVSEPVFVPEPVPVPEPVFVPEPMVELPKERIPKFIPKKTEGPIVRSAFGTITQEDEIEIDDLSVLSSGAGNISYTVPWELKKQEIKETKTTTIGTEDTTTSDDSDDCCW